MALAPDGLRPRSSSNPNGWHSESDWDYVIEGLNSRRKHSVSGSLPKGDVMLGRGRRYDIFDGPLDTSSPHITFYPQG